MLKVQYMLSHAGNPDKPNEDLIFCSDNCIAVLDGATNLNGSDYGANEFVGDFVERFAPLIKSLPLPQAVCTAVTDLYRYKIGNRPAPRDIALYSSAAAAFAVETETSLLVMTLGDCAALIFTDDGVKKIKNTALEKLDAIVTSRLKQLHEQTGADVADLLQTAEIHDMLIENRKKMNTADGYKSISFNLNPLTDGDVNVIDKSKIQKAVLYSDGFQSMEREIIDGMPVDEMYKILRQNELADRKLNKHPRFKISDDASIVCFTVKD